jgi:hypothetical protein
VGSGYYDPMYELKSDRRLEEDGEKELTKLPVSTSAKTIPSV